MEMTEQDQQYKQEAEATVSASTALKWLRQDVSPEHVDVEFMAMKDAESQPERGVTFASWIPPVGSGRGARHAIVVFPQSLASVTGMSVDERARYLERTLRHESWHARLTDRDAHMLQYTAEYYKVPPPVFNVFEDARIEESARWEEMDDFGYFVSTPDGPPSFDHEHVGDITDPLDLFQYLSMCERYTDEEDKAIAKWKGEEFTFHRGKRHITTSLIKWFLGRASRAQSTRRLWAPMLEFIEAFPQYKWTKPNDPEQAKQLAKPKDEGLAKMAPSRGENVTGHDGSKEKGEGEGDGSEDGDEDGDGDGEDEGEGKGKMRGGGLGYCGEWDPSYQRVSRPEKFKESLLRDKPEKLEFKKKDTPTITVSDSHGLEPFTNGHPHTQLQPGYKGSRGTRQCEMADAPKVAAIFRRMMGFTDASRTRTSTSGSHLHMPNVMTGDSAAFRRTITRKGRRKICIVMDMSGSMSTTFHRQGAAFIESMYILKREGLIDLTVWLSGGGQRFRLPDHASTACIAELTADLGCESIMATLESAKHDVMEADTVLIYTDGALTDGDIDTKKWGSRGVNLIGVSSLMYGTDFLNALYSGGKWVGGSSLETIHSINTNNKPGELRQLRERMNHHFHKSIVAESGIELATMIVQYVLKREG